MINRKIKNVDTILDPIVIYQGYLENVFLVEGTPVDTKTKEFDISTKYINKFISKDDYDKLMFVHATILLSMYKEEILEKTETKEIILNMPEEQFKLLMRNIVNDDGTKYSIGTLTFEERKNALELIRNKILHGDYYLDNGNIVLNDNGNTSSISISDYVEMCISLVSAKSLKSTGPIHRPITLTKKDNIKNDTDIITLKDLKRFMSNIYFYDFVDEPEPGYKRTANYVGVVTHFYESLTNVNNMQVLKNHNIDSYISILLQRYKQVFKDNHINLTYTRKPITSSPKYNRIVDMFKNTKEIFASYTPQHKRDLLYQFAANVVQEENSNELVLAASAYNNIKILKTLKNDKEKMSFNDFNRAQSVTFIDDITIANSFAYFYALYHYGLDELFSKGANTLLKDIVQYKNIDFSELELDKLYDPSMDIEIEFVGFQDQLNSMIKSAPNHEAKYDNAIKQYHGYTRHSKTIDQNKVQEFQKRIVDAYKTKVNEASITSLSQIFMDDKFDLYVRNFNIINHIRNAFAHGNVYLKSAITGDTKNDKYIVIEDIHEGRMTYRKEIKYIDFYQLFSETNQMIMRTFYRCRSVASLDTSEMTLDEIMEKLYELGVEERPTKEEPKKSKMGIALTKIKKLVGLNGHKSFDN